MTTGVELYIQSVIVSVLAHWVNILTLERVNILMTAVVNLVTQMLIVSVLAAWEGIIRKGIIY